MLQLTVNNNNIYSIETNDDRTIVNGMPASPDISIQPNGLVSILHKGKSYTGTIERIDNDNKEVTVKVNGQSYNVAVKEPIDLLLNNMGLDVKANKKAGPIKAPMPGIVIKMLVTPGQQINKGDALVILEAMKMENILKAQGPGIVKTIKVNERTPVDKGAILIELE